MDKRKYLFLRKLVVWMNESETKRIDKPKKKYYSKESEFFDKCSDRED